MQLEKIKSKIISSLLDKPKRIANRHDIQLIQDELWSLYRKSSGEDAPLAKVIRSNIEQMEVFLVCDKGDELIYSYEPPPYLQNILEPGWVAISKG